MLICDSQVHGPDTPHAGHVGGLDLEPLLREMDAAGVDRCIVVPLDAPGDDLAANNPAALAMVHERPDRLAVMGRIHLANLENARLLPGWKADPSMLGIRVAFHRDPHLSLLKDRGLEWFWRGAEDAGIPIMMLVPNELVATVGAVAERHPRLRLVVDHLGLTPYVHYDDLMPPLAPLLGLARHPNVAVKASALPDSVPDAFPFPSLHDPLHAVIDAFGPRRVFWGSDFTRTRVKCPYDEIVRLFRDELTFLSPQDREWILGRGVTEWLGWP